MVPNGLVSLKFIRLEVGSTEYGTRTNRLNLTNKIDKPHSIKDGRTVEVENENLYDMFGRDEGNFIKGEA